MVTQDQSDVIDLLATPVTHGVGSVERIDTHASIVFLAGVHAYKLKRAVRYDYLDYSTPERRRAMCEEELRINRVLAPALYRRVLPVTRGGDGALALGGDRAAAVDWVLEMTRFDQDALFERLAARGALDSGIMAALGATVAQFHTSAERCPRYGGAASMRWVVDGNASGLIEQGRTALDQEVVTRMTGLARLQIATHAALLDARRDAGLVRRCHGDLHLRNIVLLDGTPTLFDAVEFNDQIACIDVAYDLAFLLMDLWRRRLPAHANRVWNAYLYDSDDFEAIALMPLFLSCRAAVRAKTSITAANLESDPARRDELVAAAREYVALAERLLTPAPPCLMAIGGFSGSGKSTLARALAPSIGAVPGAVVLRSDEVRKQLWGVDPLEHLGPEAYTPDASREVYVTLAARAASVVRSGHAAIVDAVYAEPYDRVQIEHVAAANGVPFVGLWLDAPAALLVRRTDARTADASDADRAIVGRQLETGAGAVSWLRIDAAKSPADVEREAGAAIGLAIDSPVSGRRPSLPVA